MPDPAGLRLETHSRTAVVVVNHNTREELRACLASLESQAPAEVVVVDCASTDGSVEMVRECFPAVAIVSKKENLGYGWAINRGVSATHSPYLLLLNSDTQVQAGAVPRLQHYMDLHPNAGVVGPRLRYPDGRLQRSARRFPGTLSWLLDNSLWGHWLEQVPGLNSRVLNAWPHTGSRTVPWVVGAAMAARRTALAAVSGFDESYFLFFEEIDLCDRLWTAGWEVHFTSAAEVLHLGGGSTRQYGCRKQEQYVVSAMQFYRRRYSRARFAMLKMILQLELATRLCRGSLTSFVGAHRGCRTQIKEDVENCRHLISVLSGISYSESPVPPAASTSTPLP